jgi:23S rRNA (uracil1939-C5)-methyltransferase
VEQDRSSTADARVNCRGAEIVVADAGKLKAGAHFFDVAILDPPRAGAPGVIPRLLVTRPRALLYVSCEPTTLARDIAPAVAGGYRVSRVQPYDMFPGTDHVETFVVLER